jgi:hypothetical protein
MTSNGTTSVHGRTTAPILAVISTVVFCLSTTATLIGARYVLRNLIATPLRKELPRTARDIHEWRWEESGLTGQDYLYLLKARITEQEFQGYVDKLGMTPHTSSRQYQHGFHPHWHPVVLSLAKDIDWWTPSKSTQATYVLDGGDWWTYAKYENGYVYVVSLNI